MTRIYPFFLYLMILYYSLHLFLRLNPLYELRIMFAEFMLPGQKFNWSFAYSDDLLFDPTSAISDDDGGRQTEVQSWKKTHVN